MSRVKGEPRRVPGWIKAAGDAIWRQQDQNMLASVSLRKRLPASGLVGLWHRPEVVSDLCAYRLAMPLGESAAPRFLQRWSAEKIVTDLDIPARKR